MKTLLLTATLLFSATSFAQNNFAAGVKGQSTCLSRALSYEYNKMVKDLVSKGYDERSIEIQYAGYGMARSYGQNFFDTNIATLSVKRLGDRDTLAATTVLIKSRTTGECYYRLGVAPELEN